MIGLVLLQRSEGGGLGVGGGGGFMTNRGTANVLTRATAILAGVFFVTSLGLSIIASLDRRPTSIIPGATAPSPSSPGDAPSLGAGGSILDQLKGPEPAAPAPPSGPQVPRSQ
jgi:preprotein translocase subunit SecG